MTLAAVLANLHYYQTGETLPGASLIEQMNGTERSDFETHLSWLYNSSDLAEDIIEAATAAGTINVGRSKPPNPALTVLDTTSDTIGFNYSLLSQSYFVNESGLLVLVRPELYIIHEFWHVSTSTGDPASDIAAQNVAGFDFQGGAVDAQNDVATELADSHAGFDNQQRASYNAALTELDDRFDKMVVGISYSSNIPIAIARFGDRLGVQGNDNLDTSARNDFDATLAFGFDGDDTIVTSKGTDFLYGGDGGDTLSGGEGKDELHGQNDDDTLRTDKGNDLLHGGDHRGFGTSGRTSLQDDGKDVVNYSLNPDFTASGVKISIFAGNDTVNPDQTFAPSTTATDPDDFLTALFVKDLAEGGATDTLISIETITATAAADTLEVRSLEEDKFAGEDGKGGAHTIDLHINPAVTQQGMGDHVDFTGLEEDVTLNLTAATIAAGTINLHATEDDERGLIVKGVERVTGGEGHLTVWSGGNGEYHAGAGGGTFHLAAGDVAYGHAGVVDKFYVSATVPEGATDAEKLAFIQANRIMICGGLEETDEIYIGGELFNGNTVTSEFCPVFLPNGESGATAIQLSGNSTWGTTYASAYYVQTDPSYIDERGNLITPGYYTYAPQVAYRDVILTQADPGGTAMIEFISTTLTGGAQLTYDSSVIPEASLTLMIEGYSSGDGGMVFGHDALAMRSGPFARTQGFTYSGVDPVTEFGHDWPWNSWTTFDISTRAMIGPHTAPGPVELWTYDLRFDVFDGNPDGLITAGGPIVSYGDDLQRRRCVERNRWSRLVQICSRWPFANGSGRFWSGR